MHSFLPWFRLSVLTRVGFAPFGSSLAWIHWVNPVGSLRWFSLHSALFSTGCAQEDGTFSSPAQDSVQSLKEVSGHPPLPLTRCESAASANLTLLDAVAKSVERAAAKEGLDNSGSTGLDPSATKKKDFELHWL